MRNKISTILKVTIITSIILLLTIFIYAKLTGQTVLAVIENGKSGAEATAESLQRAIDDAKEWVDKKDNDGEIILRNPTAPTLAELLPPEQVTEDGLYITSEDLHNIASLFCCAKGVALPSKAQTIVTSGAYSTDTTDQGKKTAYLTVDDIPYSTVFRNENIVSDWIDANTYPDASSYLAPTDSKTLAKFHLAELRDCTPAEAWVLAEFDKNVSSIVSTFQITDEEYTENDLGERIQVGDDTLYLVGDTGEERYVIEKEGKYYYVNLDNVSEYAPYSYVQYAWWKVKTVGENTTSDIKDTDLAHEAEAFEEYIKAVTGVSDVKDLERNEDGTFKIDYKVAMEPENSEDIKVGFNSEKNRYILGPFKVNYVKSAIQVGDRAKVNFSGIDNCILVGTDAEGNELLDAEGNSALKLNENYWFTYVNDADHENKLEDADKKEPLYEYPLPNDEFYLEISYLDDLAAIKNFKFDFQYKTASGQYEYYEGTYLEIHWDADFDEEDSQSIPTNSQARIIDNHITVASSRAPVRADTGSSAVGKEIPFDEDRSFGLSNPSWGGLGARWGVDADSEMSIDDNYITITGSIAKNWLYGGGDYTLTITGLTATGADSITYNGTTFEIKYKRDYTKARINQSCPISISYSLDFANDTLYADEADTISRTPNLFYENKLLGDSAKIKDAGSKVVVDGKKIYVRGMINSEAQTIDFDANMIHGDETPQSAVYKWWVDDGEGLTCTNESDGIFRIEKPGTCRIGCATGEDYGGPSVEVKVFEVTIPEFCFMDEVKDITISEGEIASYYNAMGSVKSEVKKQTISNEQVRLLSTRWPRSPGEVYYKLIRTLAYYKDLYKDEYPTSSNAVLTDGEGRELTITIMLPQDVEEFDDEEFITDNTTNSTPSPSSSPSPSNSPDNGNGGNGGNGGSGDNGNDGNGGNGGSGDNGNGGNGGNGGSGDNGNGGNGGNGGSGDNGNGGNGGNGGSGDNGNGGNGGNGGSGDDEGDASGDTTGEAGTDTTQQYKYKFYLRATSASHQKAQAQANAVGSHKVVDVTAENGLAERNSQPVELEMLKGPINLRTSLAGMVWIDHDEAKDQSTGTLGIFDGIDTPAPENSVEVIVWKVIYEKSGNNLTEIDREKAIGWKEDGTVIDFIENKLFIDKDGKYSVPEIQVPAVEGLDTSKYVASYDVEFIYDGQTYEATEYLKSTGKDTVKDKLDEFKKTPEETDGDGKDYEKYAKDSYIVENADERKKFDSYFTEVYGDKPVSTENGETQGKSTGGENSGVYDTDEYREPAAKETTLNYNSKFVVQGNDGNIETVDQTNDPNAKLQSNLITKDSDGYVLDQYRFASRTSEAGLLLPYESKYHILKENYNNIKFKEDAYKPIDEYFHQLNLGLLERYHTDVSILKDLYSAKVVVNQQQTDYTFNSLAELTNEALNQQLDDTYRTKKYKLSLYNSDYNYRSSVYSTVETEIEKQIFQSIKAKTELRLFVKYKIAIYNNSELTDVSINEFADYYDKAFTLVQYDEQNNDEALKYQAFILDNEGNRNLTVIADNPYYRKLKPSDDDVPSEQRTELYSYDKQKDLQASRIDNNVTGNLKFDYTDESGKPINANDYYKVSTSTSLKALNEDKTEFNQDLSLEPGEVMEVFVTYEIDAEGFKDAVEESRQKFEGNSGAATVNRDSNLLGNKCNIAEITRFSSAYTDESVGRHKTTRYTAGQISGRVDRDSAPDNINMAEIVNKEDNNILTKFFEDDTETAPVLTVDKTEAIPREINGVVWKDGRADYGLADGLYNDSEAGIDGVDVTLVEKIKVNPGDMPENADLNSLDYEFEFVWPNDAFPENNLKSRTTTSDGGKYKFEDFVPGIYVVRFEYGNNDATLEYNGQDYQNTTYQKSGETNMINVVPTDENKAEGSVVLGTSDYDKGGKTTLNNEWHDLSNNAEAKKLEETRVSDARDYEPRRLKVNAYSRTVTNKNAEVLAAFIDDEDTNLTEEYKQLLEGNKEQLKEYTKMVANTAKLNIEVEKQDQIAYKEVAVGNAQQTDTKIVETTVGDQNEEKNHEYIVKDIDFGLVERPETRINIRKDITTIQLLKNDGSAPVMSVTCDENGNIIRDDPNAVRLDKISEIRKEELPDGTQGFKYISIESSFLKGLSVKLTYTITLENNSEVDYVATDLASTKNIQKLFNNAEAYESSDCFAKGEGIVYGSKLGLYYYTNEKATEDNEEEKHAYNYQEDVEVKTTIDQVIDYVDNDLSIDETASMGNTINNFWVSSSEEDRTYKLSEMSTKDIDMNNNNTIETDEKDKLVDNKDREYVSDTGIKNNLVLSYNELMGKGTITYNTAVVNPGDGSQEFNEGTVDDSVGSKVLTPKTEQKQIENTYTTLNVDTAAKEYDGFNIQLTQELATKVMHPDDASAYSRVIYVSTTAQANEEAINNMNYDNLVEIVMYSNAAGRRDTAAIPGNANMIAKCAPTYIAGYDYDYVNKVYMNKKLTAQSDCPPEYVGITTERDAFASKDTITFSEPTGLSIEMQRINKVVRIILIGLIIAAIAVIIATVTIVIKKTKYDDEDLLNTENKN